MFCGMSDFSKALKFDTVSHDKLLHKVETYGIRGPVLKWLTSFLKERIMYVMVAGTYSDTASVDSGSSERDRFRSAVSYKRFTKFSEMSRVVLASVGHHGLRRRGGHLR